MADYKKADTILHCQPLKQEDNSSRWYLDTEKGWLYNSDGFWLGTLGVDHKSFTFFYSKKIKSLDQFIYFGYHWDRNTGLMKIQQVLVPKIKKYIENGEMSHSEKEKWWTIISPSLDFWTHHTSYRYFDQKIDVSGPTVGQNISAGGKDLEGFTASNYHKRFFDAIDSWPELKLQNEFNSSVDRKGHFTESFNECRKINQTLENKF